MNPSEFVEESLPLPLRGKMLWVHALATGFRVCGLLVCLFVCLGGWLVGWLLLSSLLVGVGFGVVGCLMFVVCCSLVVVCWVLVGRLMLVVCCLFVVKCCYGDGNDNNGGQCAAYFMSALEEIFMSFRHSTESRFKGGGGLILA